MTKLIQLGKNNSLKLDEVLSNQERLELLFNDQKLQISRIISRLDRLEGQREKIYPSADVKGKGKGKSKKTNGEFYQVNIYAILLIFFILV